MRQVWISRRGGPEVLEVREAPDPAPGPGEVLIKVAAAGVNFADVMARMGLYPDAPPLPCVVGYEVSGTVEDLGAGAAQDGLRRGDRVLALARFGGYSDMLAVPRNQVAPVPDGLSFEQAAAIPVNYLTAWLMLIHLGNLHRGERVLIHAAAGGVGQAAVQIARWRGAEIIGTASQSKHARLRDAGVQHCIDYTRQDFAAEVQRLTRGHGVDIVLDAVGGGSFRKSYRSLAPLGRLFMFGAASLAPGQRRSIWSALRVLASMPRFRAIPLMNENRGVFGINLGHLWGQVDLLRTMLLEVLDLTANKTLGPVIDSTYPFSRAADAHARLQSRQSFGKVLLTPD
ncbi:MAG TPA: medium chain dehydrogenase/reductase family protein [Kofleriaceae bacterium]|nr:medium chain dehydrogenase/reductase family protein [Kofleriaceae bacterium]